MIQLLFTLRKRKQCKSLRILFPTYVEYFSDGCESQYKNKKSFYNLCMHNQDYSMQASWSFLHTNHGKPLCDRIGGTVKPATAIESLQRPLDNQILTAEAMITYCNQNLSNIKFVNLLKQDLIDA